MPGVAGPRANMQGCTTIWYMLCQQGPAVWTWLFQLAVVQDPTPRTDGPGAGWQPGRRSALPWSAAADLPRTDLTGERGARLKGGSGRRG